MLLQNVTRACGNCRVLNAAIRSTLDMVAKAFVAVPISSQLTRQLLRTPEVTCNERRYS